VDLLFACKAASWSPAWENPASSAEKYPPHFPARERHPSSCTQPKLCTGYGHARPRRCPPGRLYGGETEEIVRLLEALKRLEMRLVTLTGKIHSTLAEASDVALDVSVKEEACSLNLAPTASTTVAMAVGDALAVSLLERRGFRPTISRPASCGSLARNCSASNT